MQNKIRFGMYLDRKSADIVKSFLKDTGLTFSAYVDLLICAAAEKIQLYESLPEDELLEKNPIFYEKSGKRYFNILQAHKLLGLTDLADENLDIPDTERLVLSQSQARKIAQGEWKIEIDESGNFIIVSNAKKGDDVK